MEIVDDDPDRGMGQDGPSTWLIAVALCATLLAGYARASDVEDPRVAKATASECVHQLDFAPALSFVGGCRR